MTSITQLLQPSTFPLTKHTVVLHEQAPYHSNSVPTRSILNNMQQPAPSPPTEPSSTQELGAGSADSDGGDNNGDGRKGYGKRELSTSKRAAQNRAAQVCGGSSPCYWTFETDSGLESISSEEGRLYQEIGRASSRLPSIERQFQADSDRKLPTSRLHYQSPISFARISRRDSASTCGQSTARKNITSTPIGNITQVVRVEQCCSPSRRSSWPSGIHSSEPRGQLFRATIRETTKDRVNRNHTTTIGTSRFGSPQPIAFDNQMSCDHGGVTLFNLIVLRLLTIMALRTLASG